MPPLRWSSAATPLAVSIIVFAAAAAHAGLPYHDFDPDTPGVQEPQNVPSDFPLVRLFRQHQLTVRMCARADEVAHIIAPHAALGFEVCEGGPIAALLFTLNEWRDPGIAALRSHMRVLIPAFNASTARYELLLTDVLPVTEFEIEEKGGARSYAVSLEDTEGNKIRLDVVVTAPLSAFQEDPIPTPFRNLTGGRSFFVARAGFVAVFPASDKYVKVSFGSNKFTSSHGPLSLGLVVGNIDAFTPSLLVIGLER